MKNLENIPPFNKAKPKDVNIALFKSIIVLCGTDIIMQNIPHI